MHDAGIVFQMKKAISHLKKADPVMGATELAWLVLFVLGI